MGTTLGELDPVSRLLAGVGTRVDGVAVVVVQLVLGQRLGLVVVATEGEVTRLGDRDRGDDDDERDEGDAVADEGVGAVAEGEDHDGRGDEHRDEVSSP